MWSTNMRRLHTHTDGHNEKGCTNSTNCKWWERAGEWEQKANNLTQTLSLSRTSFIWIMCMGHPQFECTMKKEATTNLVHYKCAKWLEEWRNGFGGANMKMRWQSTDATRFIIFPFASLLDVAVRWLFNPLSMECETDNTIESVEKCELSADTKSIQMLFGFRWYFVSFSRTHTHNLSLSSAFSSLFFFFWFTLLSTKSSSFVVVVFVSQLCLPLICVYMSFYRTIVAERLRSHSNFITHSHLYLSTFSFAHNSTAFLIVFSGRIRTR